MKDKQAAATQHSTCVYRPDGAYTAFHKTRPDAPPPDQCHRACCQANRKAVAEAVAEGRPRPPHRCIGGFAQKYYAVN
jgi:hypothetical protein